MKALLAVINGQVPVDQIVLSPGMLGKETTLLCKIDQTFLSKQSVWPREISNSIEIYDKFAI